MINVDQERPYRETNSKIFNYEPDTHISHRALYHAIRDSGFAIIKGLPTADFKRDGERLNAALNFVSQFTFLGLPLKQNNAGDLAYLVRDEGTKVIFDEAKRPKLLEGKGSKSNAHLGFHNDAAAQWHGHQIGVVALLAFSQAPIGGDTTLIDAREAFEILEEENPTVADILTNTTFYFDRSSGYDIGQRPYAESPIISLNPKFKVRYTPRIHQGFETARKNMTNLQQQAIIIWDELLERENLQIKFKLDPGEIVFLNEDIMLHARSEYQDDVNNPRTLARMWLNNFMQAVGY